MEFKLTSDTQTVSELMSCNLLLCEPNASLQTCASRMRAQNVSSIFIAESGQIKGIWTESDCMKLDFSDPKLREHPVSQYMSSPVKQVSPDTLLSDVTMLFHNLKLRHLLVSDGEQALGVISLSDIVHSQGLEHYLHFRTIANSYCDKVPRVDSEEDMTSVAKTMRASGANYVLVHNAQCHSYGIITQRDLVRLIVEPHKALRCWEFASWPLYTITPDTSLFKAYNLLKIKKIRHLVVIGESENLLGVLSLEHIMTEIESAYMVELKTILKQRDVALKKSQKNLYMAKQIINASLDGIMITNQSGKILQVNPAFTRLTGYRDIDVIGHNPSILSSGRHGKEFYDQMWAGLRQRGVWQGEIYNKRKNGEIYLEWLTIIEIQESQDEEVLYAAIFSDITERKRNEKRIKTLAYFDELTHLPNRRLFNDRLKVALATAHRENHKVAVMFLDLDHFKQVNDTMGHSAGDELLKVVAKRLQHCMREGDTLARLGGDEFTLLLNEVNDVDHIHNCAQRLINALRTPIKINNTEIVITTSIGGAVYPDDGADAETLLKHADIAMYRSKEIGRNSFQLYKPAMNARSLERMAIESRFKKALGKQEFRLDYQPKVHALSKMVVGAEALLRWQDPELGYISPANFIPLAEELGMIVELDLFVINQACKQAAEWLKQGVPFERISINISALHFTQGNLVIAVQNALNIWQLDAKYLEIEVTETSFIRSLNDAKTVLLALKKLGVKIALDDFGTGYSALSYLTKLPIDVLKIDSSFVAKVPDEYGNSQIVRAITALAHSLDLELVAEGVEQAHQLHFLQQLDCHVIQGYFFSKPLAADAFATFCLTQQHKQSAYQVTSTS